MNSKQLVWSWIGFLGLITVAFILSAVAIPRGPFKSRAPLITCRNNLRRIEGAKGIWALHNHKTAEDTPRDDDLFGRGKPYEQKPVCPSKGRYAIGTVSQKATCSIHGDTY